MGSSLSSSARQIAERVAPGATRTLKPFSPDEIAALNRLAEQDLARMRDLPSAEELNSKNLNLDGFLNKLGSSISGRDLSPDAPPHASTSGRSAVQMPPARPPNVLRAAEAAAWKKNVQSADDQPGRLQSYVIREILEARTSSAAERKDLVLEPFVRIYGADESKLRTLMEYNCIPAVGKFATFGHQYAFARAPNWWLREGRTGAQFLSEPDELRRRLMGNPVVTSRNISGGEEPGGNDDIPPAAASVPKTFGGGLATPTQGKGPYEEDGGGNEGKVHGKEGMTSGRK